ncbi:5'-nucleotidase C-terminal domain-containing protein [Alteromonas sp. D210916BOD_24]|uniref:bifunctional metallophosphatase/5'-nucleotidase n=1 Tax=Alteromonas sp. D210916BOD_24 TaxID=3157618 RepID=UPI00399C5796
MSKKFVLLVPIALLFILAAHSAVASHKNDNSKAKVTLLLTADMPDISDRRTGQYASLQTLVKQYRAQNNNVFFVFGGGSIGPSALASFDRGSHIIDLLNSIEPDVMAVTKREFSFYEDELSLRSYEAAFPFVASNVLDKRVSVPPDGLQTSVLVEKGNLALGVISVLHERVIEEYQLFNIAITPAQKAILDEAEQLRGQGADMILLHYSYPFPFVDTLLTEGVIDAAFITDSRLNEADLADIKQHPNNLALTRQGSAIVANFSRNKNKNSFDPWQLAAAQEVELDEYEKDALLQQQQSGYETRLERLLNIQIGEWQSPISTLRQAVRSQENAFANFVTDTMRDYGNADIALINGGSIRGDRQYAASSPITRQDIVRELPFRAHVVTLTLTGRQVVQALEEGVSQYETNKGGFPHVSGLSYTFNPNLDVMSRVTNVLVGQQPIQPDTNYKIITSHFLADGGDGYVTFKQAPRKYTFNPGPPQVTDLVIQAIVRKYAISVQVEGRISKAGGQ